MNYWIITVKNPYCDYILRGLKTMELRKVLPPVLRPGDVIFIARKGDHGSIVGACHVTYVCKGTVDYFYNNYYREHRVILAKLNEYVGDHYDLYGIGLKRMVLDSWCLNVRSFGYERAPQSFYRIKPEFISTIKRVLDVKQTKGGENE